MKKIYKRIIIIVCILLALGGLTILGIAGYEHYIVCKAEEHDKAVQDSLASSNPALRDACALNQLHQNANNCYGDYYDRSVISAVEKSDNPQLLFEGAKCIEGNDFNSHRQSASNSDRAYKMAYLYMLAAEKGHPTAQAEFSRCLMNGFGTSRNYVKAFYWAKKSAEANDSVGIYALGTCLINGYGTEVNRERGVELLRQSANTGYERAQQHLMSNY